MIKRLIFLLLAFSLLSVSSIAQKVTSVTQMTDKQIDQLVLEIESRGLSEAEVEIMAKAQGYTDADIAIVRERINKAKSGLNTKKKSELNVIEREQLGEISKRVVKEQVTDTIKVKQIFGAELFKINQLSFEPNLRIATPTNYIVGPDDELAVDISGYAVANYNLKVSPEGTVKLENLAPIYVNGLTIEQVKTKIHQRLSSLFAGLRNGSLTLDLTLTKVRSIRVNIAGEVSSPGTYTLSSFSTLFNALYLSGGPSKNGSFRNVQLLRNNKLIQSLDIYEFLVTGNLKGNIALQDQDVIFIPVAETWIELEGEIVRPLRFELKPSESIEELIKYAGGFTPNAYKAQLRLNRNTGVEKELRMVDANNFSEFLLKSGDKIEVGAILDRYTNRVEVMGAVFRPGEYALSDKIKTVGDLIREAEGLREDAFRGRALIKRLGKDLDPVIIPIDLDSILKGFDLPLKREDILVVKSITELRELRKVDISGKVNIPGEYDYADNMSLNDLIIIAGGLGEGASMHRIEVSRRISGEINKDRKVDVFSIDLNQNLSSESGNFILKPYDYIIVRELPNYQVQELVVVTGQVYYSGYYSITNPTERISELIQRAGGLRNNAYLNGGQFFRKGKQVALNLEDVLQHETKSYNLFLQPGDSLHIPVEKQTIKVTGQVLNPTSVAYQENLNFKDYIIQAGGYTDSAFVKKIYVKYPNGHVDKVKTFLTVKVYPKVEKGMEIIVPTKRREKMSKAEVIAVSTGMISLSAVLLTLFRIL